jgi:hypothetical protein
MEIHVKPYIDDYWNTSNEDRPIHRSVRKTMGIHRWKQIDRYFYIWNSALNQLLERSNNKIRSHEKVDPL